MGKGPSRSGRGRVNRTVYPTHTCFDDATLLLAKMVVGVPERLDAFRLVHGVSMALGHPSAHGWVEDVERGVCIFTGILDGERQDFEAPRGEYYIQLRITERTAYTVRGAHDLFQVTNHAGPWLPRYRQLCSVPDAQPWIDIPPNITCPKCNLTSFHPADVTNHYCGKCHQFHDDMEPDPLCVDPGGAL